MAQDGTALIVEIKTEYWANLSDDGTPLRSGGQGEHERTRSTCGLLSVESSPSLRKSQESMLCMLSKFRNHMVHICGGKELK